MSKLANLARSPSGALCWIWFGTAWAAELSHGGPLDPDLIPVVTLAWVVFYTFLGWGASELDSLADLLNADTKLRWGVGKKIFASAAAGLITGLCVLSYAPGWGKLAAYASAFFAAFGGAAYITPIARSFTEVARMVSDRVFKRQGGRSE